MVLSAQELCAIEKMAIDGTGNKKIATQLGLPQSTTKRWLYPSKTQRKNTSFNTSFDNPLQSPQDTGSTTDTDNTCLPEKAPPDPQLGPEAHFSFTNIPHWAPGIIFFLSVAQVAEYRVPIRENTCFEQHAFFSIHWVFCMMFVFSNFTVEP